MPQHTKRFKSQSLAIEFKFTPVGQTLTLLRCAHSLAFSTTFSISFEEGENRSRIIKNKTMTVFI